VGKIKVVEYLLNGISVFGKWFADLEAQAAAKEGDYADYKTISQNNFTACRE
jgi:hypothetical protein